MEATRNQIALIIGGVLGLVFGILLADVVIDSVTTALTNASIGSFAGAASIGGLIPFIYFTVVILIAVGMMGIGANGLRNSSLIAGAPLILAVFTPIPVTVALIGVLAFGAIYSFKKYQASRQFAQLA